MPSGGRGNTSDKGNIRSCSPCCAKKDSEESPPLLPAKPLYTGDVMKPTQGTLPSSKAGFLVSFLVDARGGAMTGHRHWGMRVIIPPAAVQQPTRINCRYQKLTSLPFPPPFMEREALASRVIEVTPAGETFRSPVLIEIPHFASNAGAERETIVLRSDDGETWYEHVSDEVENGEIYQDVVTSVVMKDSNLERIYDVLEVTKGRIIRILTSKFPKYFAVLTRVREEVKSVGPDGGKVVLLHEPRLRATFPKNALYKKIKVGLQVQSLKPEIVQAAFGRSVEVSKMIAVEPRKRKFHQPIFISIPLPCSPSKINPSTSIRLLCSVTGATEKAVWADLTGSTPLELCKDVVHFSTKVSAIFWILVIHDKQRDPESALTLASRLYEESILIPYLARFSIFYRENFPKAWVNTIRVYCMTDDKAEKVIRSLQGFRPLAISGDIEVSHTSSIAVKLSGNVIQLRQDPFTGELLAVSSIRTNEVKEPFVFKAFEENSMTILVEAKDPAKPVSGCLSFGRRLDHISATQQLPLCDLRFDVSSGDTGFVIQDGEVAAFDNGHAPEIIDVAPAIKTFKTIEEEDPYEKIEIKKNTDGVVDEKNKINQAPAKQSSMKQNEKKEKTKSSKESEMTKKTKLKETSTIVKLTKSNVNSSQENTSRIEAKSETQKDKEKKIKNTAITQVKTNVQGKGLCVHDISISDFCHKCSEEQKAFERCTSIAPSEAEDDRNKKNIKNKETIVDVKQGKKLEGSDKEESKIKKSQKKQISDISICSCIHDINLKDSCNKCIENQKSLDRRASKVTIDNKPIRQEKSEKNVKESKSDKSVHKEEGEKIESEKTKKEKKLEIKSNAELKSQNKCNKDGSSKMCIHDIAIDNFCKTCTENQQSMDRRGSKMTTENMTNVSETFDTNKKKKIISKSNEKEELNIKNQISQDGTELDNRQSKLDDSRKNTKESRFCIHAVPLADSCHQCIDNQRSLSRTRTKVSDTNDSEITKKQIEIEPKQHKENVPVMISKSPEVDDKTVLPHKKKKENIAETKIAEDKINETKKIEDKVIDHKKTEESVSQPKPRVNVEKSKKECIHNIQIQDICKSCEENQRSLNIETPSMPEISEAKNDPVKQEKVTKKDKKNKKLQDKEDDLTLAGKEVFHNLDTGVRMCIHNVLIEDFCQSCSESQPNVGVEKGTYESKEESVLKSNTADEKYVKKKPENKEETVKKGDNKSKLAVDSMSKETKLCIHEVVISDFCKNCDHGKTGSQVNTGQIIQKDERKSKIRDKDESSSKDKSEIETIEYNEAKKGKAKKDIVSEEKRKESDAFTKDGKKKN